MGNSDWELYTLGDLTENFDSIRVPVKEADRKKGQYPYYGASGIIDMVDGYLFDGEYLLVAEDGENLRSRKTPVAFIASGKFWVNNHAHIVRGNEIASTRFLMYYLSQTDISGFLTGSTLPKLTQDNLNRIPIYAPSLPEQRAIAGILGALDDKIELNRRMNRTLESMARGVFREMMKDVEEQGSILELANLLSGGTPSTAEESYWNGSIEWVSAKDVSNADGLFLLDTEKKITQDGVDNSATKLLPAKTVIVTARGTVGAHCMLGKPMTMNQTNYGLKAKEGIGDYFVFFTLSEMVEQLKQQSYGTIFDTITTKTFQNALCAQPSVDVIQKFEGKVTPMMDAILNNQKESRTLASLRDSLLPRLMQGEVRVSAL
jgi:type I restriction enzyme S subunit